MEVEGGASQIRVLFLSKQRLLRESFARIFAAVPDLLLLPPVSDPGEARELIVETHPDLILVDLNPSLFGLRVTSTLREACPECRILIISSYADPVAEAQLALAGVQGFISKDIGIDDLLRAIRETVQGKHLFGDPEPHANGSGQSRSRPMRALTSREAQVLELIARGYANKQVAAQLGISIKTVEKHRQSVMCKLQAHETAGLSWRAFCMGLSQSS